MKRTQSIFIIAVASLVLTWGVFVVLVVTTGGRNTDLADRVTELETKLQKAAHAESLKALVLDTADERAELSSRLVKAEAVVDFIKEVEALGRTSGAKLTIDSVEIKQVPDSAPEVPIELLSVSLSAEGSWAALMHLAALVEALPAKATIDRVNFSLASAGASRTAAAWNASMQFSVAKEKALE